MRFATSNPSRLTILAVLLGLLAFPSECSRFPGPHSLFMNVDAMVMDDVATQDGPGAAQRHGDHRPARGSGVSVFDIPTGQADVATSGPDAMPDAATAPPSSTAQRTPPPPAQTAASAPTPHAGTDATAFATLAHPAPAPATDRSPRPGHPNPARWAGIVVPPQSPPPRSLAA